MAVKDVLKDNKKYLLLSFGLLAICLIAVFSMNKGLVNNSLPLVSDKDTYTKANNVVEDGIDYSINIKTIYGDILVDLYEEDAPESTNSFLFLISKKYYEDLSFHKVIKDFVIQAGDVSGKGDSDPGYDIKKENLSNVFTDYDVGMANASQFFIVLPNADTSVLNGEYTLVGRVTKGFAVVDSIANVEIGDEYKPVNPATISFIQILEN